MELHKIRNIEDLANCKKVLAVRIAYKERDLKRHRALLKHTAVQLSQPLFAIRKAVAWLFGLGGFAGQSLGYKIGYSIASFIFKRRKKKKK